MEENNQPTSPADEQPTNKDILDAIQFYAQAMDKRFDGVDGRLDKIENRMDNLENKMNSLENRMDNLEAKISSIQTELDTIKTKLDQAIKTETEDTGAISGNYLDLAKRVKIVEEQLEQLKLQKQVA